MRQLWKKWGYVFWGMMFTMFLVTGCQKETAPNKTKAKSARAEKVLSYSILSPVVDLDPQKLNQMDASTVGYHIYEGLVRNEEGQIVPAGAREWTISENGKKYVFTLRKNCWRNGEPVTAGDYVRGIRRLVTKDTESDYGFLGYYIKNGAAVHHGALKKNKLGVKALNQQQIEIILEEKLDCFLQILSMVQFSPIPKEALSEENLGISKEYLYENGPFYVEAWNRNGLILRKNPNYWNVDEVKLDKVIITKKDSIKEAREAYEQGESNLFTGIYLPAEEKEESYSLYRDGQLSLVRLNLKNKKLANQDFRKALFYSVDQEKLNEQIYGKMHSSTVDFVLPELFGKEEEENSSYDPQAAVQFMEKAKKELGWQKQKPWKLTLVCPDVETRKQAGIFLKEQWEEILGIKVEIQAVSFDERFALEAQGKFDMILTKWVPDYGDPAAYLENWMSESPYNQGSFKDKAFDKKMKQAEAANGEKRTGLLKEAEEILLEKIPAIPLYFRKKVLMVKPEVEKLVVYYIGYQYNYIHCDIKQ